MTKPKSARDRLIVALDVPTAKEALSLADTLGDGVVFYKVGLELFVAEGLMLVRELQAREKRVFLDLKIDDIENTIERTVAVVARAGVDLLTVFGPAATVRAARRGRGDHPGPKILAVTMLSSRNEEDLREMSFADPDGSGRPLVETYVRVRARQLLGAGADGLISSGATMKMLRDEHGSEPIIVTPGIRPAGSGDDDHKRITTPGAAISSGADYLVVGRPVRRAIDPRAAADAIVAEIDGVLRS